MRTWARRELAPWRRLGLSSESFSEALDREVSLHGQMFRYDISGGEVLRRPKPPETIVPGTPEAMIREIEARADAYGALLRQSLPLAGAGLKLSLGIEVGDIPPEVGETPFFAFQRRKGEGVILLPDVDLLEFEYLEPPYWRDPLRFSQKRNEAIFVGSTTGEEFTLAKVHAQSPPRLRAACAFRDSPSVTFQLPRIVQCDTPETEAAIRALGLGEREVPWAEQMAFRHLLSMDGNGATCSRVAGALHSNSVLLKYESPYELFYFPALEPWRHFVPITQDADVEAVVADSARRPRHYARIARAGRRFFQTHLTRAACRRYVAALLREYAALLA